MHKFSVVILLAILLQGCDFFKRGSWDPIPPKDDPVKKAKRKEERAKRKEERKKKRTKDTSTLFLILSEHTVHQPSSQHLP